MNTTSIPAHTTGRPSYKLIREADKKPTLEQAQNFVGGYVELVNSPLFDDVQLIVNEEGVLFNLPFNPVASIHVGFPIYGPALILVGPARWMPED